MNKDVKSAFRVYDSKSEQFGLNYNGPPVNNSHPDAINVKLLGSYDQQGCQNGEFCTDANLRTNTNTGLPMFLNWNFALYFPNHIISKQVFQLLSSSDDYAQYKLVFEKCEFSFNRNIVDYTTNEINNISRCITSSLSTWVKLQNHVFNCIGFAFGVKEFITSDVYVHNNSLTPEENVRKLVEIIKYKYIDKSSNIIGLIDEIDPKEISIKCSEDFEKFNMESHIYQDNDIVLYFTGNFHYLLHGARFVKTLGEDIDVNSFVSKLGHSYLVSHSSVDVFNRDAYGNQLCYVTGSHVEHVDEREL